MASIFSKSKDSPTTSTSCTGDSTDATWATSASPDQQGVSNPHEQEEMQSLRTTTVALLLKEDLTSAVWQDQLSALCVFRLAGPSGYRDVVRFMHIWLSLCIKKSAVDLPKYLTSATRAVTLSTLGCDSSSGRFYYTDALKRLQLGILRRAHDMLSNQSLATTMLLTFYELYTCTNTNGWIQHAVGAGTIMKARGSKQALATPGSQSMFMGFRLLLAVACILGRHANFYAEPRWQRVASKIYNGLPAKGPFSDINEEIYTEQALLCGLALQVDDALGRVLSSANPDSTAIGRALDILSQLAIRRLALRDLYRRFMERLETANQIPELDIDKEKPSPEPMPPKQVKVVRYVGAFLCSCWTTWIIVNARMAALHAAIGSYLSVAAETKDRESIASGSLLSIGQLASENEAMASAICCLVVMVDSTIPGTFIFSFAMKVAYFALPEKSPRQQWIKEQLEILDKSFGYARLTISPEDKRLETLSKIHRI